MLSASTRRFASALADLVLPPRCAGCNERLSLARRAAGADAVDDAFCAPCADSLLENSRPCLRCAHSDSAPICARCAAGAPPFSAALAPYVYGGQLRVALLRYKLAGATHLARPLGRLLAPTLSQAEPDDLVVPVPLHRRRLAQRGYNPAALLAASAVALGGARCRRPRLRFDALVRVRDTVSQSGLSREQRERNVAGAFVARPRRVAGRRVLLVDDVLTTGATAAACARALARAGARTTVVAVLTRRC